MNHHPNHPQPLQCHIHLTADQILRWYKGHVHSVVVRATSGETIQMPIAHLQPYFQHNGVHGWFQLVHSGDGRLVALEPVG